MAEVVHLLGVQIHTLSLDDLLARIAATIRAGERLMIMNVNAHAINLAYERPTFRRCLNSAGVVFCDGFGVKWGARLLGERLPHRYTPPDWIHRLAQLCQEQGYSMYFLGACPGVAQRAADRLAAAHPGLRIAGCQPGYFDHRRESPVNQAVIAQINAARPDILIVGMGMPDQEEWVAQNWDQLEVRVALTAGALLDYLAGEVRRAPRWMTDHGFEWLGRLMIEPRRLWRRYLIGNAKFLWRILVARAGRQPANHSEEG